MPAWLAVMEQVPAATRVAEAPATVHTAVVVEAKLTGSPDVALAVMVTGPEPAAELPRGPNEIVCVPAVTLKVCVTGRAAA